MPTGEILVTPSGMMYEKMVEDDMIVMDIDGNVIEGTRKPSSDTPAILHIFRERPGHQRRYPHPPAVRNCGFAHSGPDRVPRMYYRTGQCRRRQRADHTLFGCRLDRYGLDTVKYVGNGHAVILSQHGVMTVGKDLNQALYAAVYLEEAANAIWLPARPASTARSSR